MKESLHSKEGFFHTDYQQNLSLHNLARTWIENTISESLLLMHETQ